MKKSLIKTYSLLIINIVIVVIPDACWTLETNNVIYSNINTTSFNREKLIGYTSGMLCHSSLKVVHVYYENETSLSYPGQILQLLNQCGISHVVLRNKFRRSPLESLNDDGIQMYIIMILRDISQSVELNIIRKKSAAKHLTFIMLVIEDSKTVTEKWLQRTFEKFWSMWISQVVIIYSRQGIIFIYRNDPFGQKLWRKTLLGRYFLSLDELFPRGLFNMRLKPLRFCLYVDGIRAVFHRYKRLLDGDLVGQEYLIGTDGLMSRYLAERMNATPTLNRVKVYGNQSNSRDYCIHEIVNELDDVAVNLRFLSMETFYKRVEHTISLTRDDLCVMVPKAAVASPIWNLFRSFNLFVWTLIAASMIMAYVFCLFVYRRLFFGKNLLLDLLSCIISTPVIKLCQPTVSLRIFIFFWLVYGLLISSAFKANLTSSLVDRKDLPDVETIKDLAESPYLLATLPRHMKHLERYLDPENPYESKIKDKIVQIPDLHFQRLIDTNNQSYAFLQKYHISVFRATSRKHHHNGKPLYHVMSQCIVPFHGVYIVPYGSPYLGDINRLMRSAQEFGFLEMWNRQMTAAFSRNKRTAMLNRQNADEPVVLKLIHFQTAFFLLTCGLCLALFCLLLEILFANMVF